MFGLSSSLPKLVGGGGGLVCESVSKDDLLSDHFDGKQSRQSVDLPLTCHSGLTNFVFKSSEVRRLLLDMDSSGGTDPLGMFPLFLKRTGVVWKCFFGLFVRVVSRLAEDRPMSSLF